MIRGKQFPVTIVQRFRSGLPADWTGILVSFSQPIFVETMTVGQYAKLLTCPTNLGPMAT